ncbi:hypothetical protein OIDMADRAFT_21009 [Oidiodendron maius Zn]|uniref:Uncharacterized protein n=1 Tax=Oidiodendron maius (strain Zn) TaxID=913774 RepID=A0A0C3GHG2_OIDMZ|nr:hypothetical protein OIDMADRAFT_21009 [Oidiodendron maius Zn]
MASSHSGNTPGFGRKGAAGIVSPPTVKRGLAAGNIKAIRLLFVYCFACQIFSAYRAYEIYQTFDGWVGLNRKDKFFLAWGVVSTIAMAFFTPAYAVLEYRTRQMGGKAKV